MTRLVCLCVAAACGGGGGFPDASGPDSPPATGKFSLEWSVVDQASQPLSCERIAGQALTVLTHHREFDGGSTQVFSCRTGMGTSEPLVPGPYDFRFELSGIFGLYATSPEQLATIEADVTTPLQPITLQVQAVGGVALRFDSMRPGGNCASTAMNGAGINTVSITLTHNSDGACEPITLAIAAGLTRPASSYTINCTTPTNAPCIENDQVITASGVPSDAYTIRIRGRIGTADCWVNNDTIQVPPLAQVLTSTLNLAHQASTPGC